MATLVTYRVRVTVGRGSVYEVDVPTFQGSEAAARRAMWAVVARFAPKANLANVKAEVLAEV